MSHPLHEIYEEVAFIASHFHWSLADIAELEHAERHRWVEAISQLNQRANEANHDLG